MAGGGDPQSRLDRVVALIATGLDVQVCSCYVKRAGEVLELFATQGLAQEAVHKTRMRVGEGLIGAIAAHGRPVIDSDVWRNPNFSYRPETGEDLYLSMMGVPIIRGGKVIGVLAVQSTEHRDYLEDERELLETIAMVIAELIAGSHVVNPEELGQVDGIALLPTRLEGTGLNQGVNLGEAVYHRPEVQITRLVADDPAAEHERLTEALSEMRSDLDSMLADLKDAPGEYQEVLAAYRMFAEDNGWIGRIAEAIESGLTAEAAVQKVDDDVRLKMSKVSDPYIRERLSDLEDLANRLLRHLTKAGGTAASGDLPRHAVLVCKTLGPAELLDYDRTRLRGIVMEEGSANMHAVIVAKAMDIPVVGRVPDPFMRIAPYDPLVVDGDQGLVFVRPGEDVRETVMDSIRIRKQKRARYHADRDKPCISGCGARVDVLLNAGLVMDMAQLDETGADGVGLYRTEIPFMARNSLPDVEVQEALYSRILDMAGDKPVTFRTLDVGGDKLVPYWHSAPEDNPALGWRSIRITLDRPAILRDQLRALIRAARGRELRVMFPMVATVEEFRSARRLLEDVLTRESARGIPKPKRLLIGSMLEVPSLVWQLPALLREPIDFLSVGSNDLLQFTFAVDRGNPRIANRYDTLSPPGLLMLRRVVEVCAQADKPVTLCGEMAAQPLDALVLLGLGYRRLSLAAPGVGAVRQMIFTADLNEATHYVSSLLDRGEASIRERVRNFAVDHGINLLA
ncbi:MAG: phosphoenolpyruvate--protein phosphotransferase [Rhodospirillaceae bacterium]